MAYTLGEEQKDILDQHLKALSEYFDPPVSIDTLEAGWKNLDKTKQKLWSDGLIYSHWIKFEQTRFIYDHISDDRTNDKTKFNSRGICASMVLLMFNKNIYPDIFNDLYNLMDTEIVTLAEYGPTYDDYLDEITPKTPSDWDLPAFKKFCDKYNVTVDTATYKKDKPLESDFDLSLLEIGTTYFVGDKTKVKVKVSTVDKTDQSSHVILLRRTAENDWYIFDPTIGIFTITSTENVAKFMAIKEEGRRQRLLEKLGYTDGDIIDYGYRAYMPASIKEI